MTSVIQALRQKLLQQPLRRLAHSTSGGEQKPGFDVWKFLTFVFVPAWVGLTGVYVYKREVKHKEHYVRPEYKEYAHLGIRSKPFPWGDGNHSLFHNPRTNPLPNVGYEED